MFWGMIASSTSTIGSRSDALRTFGCRSWSTSTMTQMRVKQTQTHDVEKVAGHSCYVRKLIKPRHTHGIVRCSQKLRGSQRSEGRIIGTHLICVDNQYAETCKSKALTRTDLIQSIIQRQNDVDLGKYRSWIALRKRSCNHDWERESVVSKCRSRWGEATYTLIINMNKTGMNRTYCSTRPDHVTPAPWGIVSSKKSCIVVPLMK